MTSAPDVGDNGEIALSVWPRSHPCWSFPNGLHGVRKVTKGFVKRMARDAVRNGTWTNAWQQCERQSVLDSSDDIWVSDRSRWYSPKAVLWRLNDLSIELKEMCAQDREVVTYEQRVGECLDELWFCVAMLDVRAWHGPYGASMSPVGWSYRVLTQQIRWLPEMLALSNRISNQTTAETAGLLPLIPSFRYQWAIGLLECLRHLGVLISLPADYEDPEWNLVGDLVH